MVAEEGDKDGDEEEEEEGERRKEGPRTVKVSAILGPPWCGVFASKLKRESSSTEYDVRYNIGGGTDGCMRGAVKILLPPFDGTWSPLGLALRPKMMEDGEEG